jgi:uncharacterized protein YjdB
MVRGGGVFRIAVRVLPLALVVGLFGVSQADTASALGPAILLSVTVSPAVGSVAVGVTQQFTATGTYSDLSTKNLTNSVTWASSASTTATVSNASGSQGLATGVGAGAATITAKASSALISGTAVLTVTPAIAAPAPLPVTLVSVTVTPAVASVAVGATQQFTATGTYSDLSTKNLTNSVTWASSASTTATVSNASGSQGLATGVGTGAATITATDSAALISGTAAFTVTPAIAGPAPLPVTLVSVTVTPAVASVAVGATQQFTATGIYSDLSTQDLTDAVTWASSASTTATVSNASGSQGLATGVGTGAATITATDSAALISGTAVLTVTPVTIPVLSPVLVTVVVTPPVGSVAVGAGQQFTATGIYSDSSTQDLTDAVTWASSASTTATVSNASGSQGLATGVGTGAATITATDSAALISGTAVLTVTPVGVLPPAPAAAQMALSPVSGWRRTAITANGADFAPGTTVTVTYLSGRLRPRKAATTVLCTTVVQTNGTFSCHGTIPRQARSGKKGQHTIEATGTGSTGSGSAMTTSTFNLVRLARR